MPDLELYFGDDGTIRALYQEDILPELAEELGRAKTRRASQVEPGSDGAWWADMALSGYPERLGPFPRRSEALAAEVAFLRERRLERRPASLKTCTCGGSNGELRLLPDGTMTYCRGAATLGTLWKCEKTGEAGKAGS